MDATEPTTLTRSRDAAEEHQRLGRKRVEREAAQEAEDGVFEPAVKALSTPEIGALKAEDRCDLGTLYQSDDSPAFVGTLKKLILGHEGSGAPPTTGRCNMTPTVNALSDTTLGHPRFVDGTVTTIRTAIVATRPCRDRRRCRRLDHGVFVAPK